MKPNSKTNVIGGIFICLSFFIFSCQKNIEQSVSPDASIAAKDPKTLKDFVQVNLVANNDEYEKAQEEIRVLEDRLQRLRDANPIGTKGFTKAGIRKMIARLHEELAVYEGTEEAKLPESE